MPNEITACCKGNPLKDWERTGKTLKSAEHCVFAPLPLPNANGPVKNEHIKYISSFYLQLWL